MGKRGPTPTPTAILQARGSFRAPHRADAGIIGAKSLPDCPEWLSEKARSHWSKVGTMLVGMGVMHDRYTSSLALLADALADYIEATEQALGLPLWSETPGGGLKEHPIQNKKEKAFARLMQCLREHGLTPGSAGGIHANTNEKRDGIAQLKLSG